MNTRLSITLAVCVLWSAAALAGWKNVENAYESEPALVTLPSTASGQVVIRACTGCDPVILRVDNRTRYVIGRASSPPVSLAALRQAAAADGAADRLLTVFYDLETNIVTRIVLSAG
jgi:hypothetical protein